MHIAMTKCITRKIQITIDIFEWNLLNKLFKKFIKFPECFVVTRSYSIKPSQY